MSKAMANAILAVVSALALAGWSGPAPAQGEGVPAPALTTEPSPPPAGQAFPATFWLYSSPLTNGFGGGMPAVDVQGNVVRVPFDPGCGIGCPPPSEYRAFPFTMPALPAGTYTVIFGVPGVTVAEFQLAVGVGIAPAVPVPGPGTGSLLLLVLLAGAAAALHLRRQRRILHRPHR